MPYQAKTQLAEVIEQQVVSKETQGLKAGPKSPKVQRIGLLPAH